MTLSLTNLSREVLKERPDTATKMASCGAVQDGWNLLARSDRRTQGASGEAWLTVRVGVYCSAPRTARQRRPQAAGAEGALDL